MRVRPSSLAISNHERPACFIRRSLASSSADHLRYPADRSPARMAHLRNLAGIEATPKQAIARPTAISNDFRASSANTRSLHVAPDQNTRDNAQGLLVLKRSWRRLGSTRIGRQLGTISSEELLAIDRTKAPAPRCCLNYRHAALCHTPFRSGLGLALLCRPAGQGVADLRREPHFGHRVDAITF